MKLYLMYADSSQEASKKVQHENINTSLIKILVAEIKWKCIIYKFAKSWIQSQDYAKLSLRDTI